MDNYERKRHWPMFAAAALAGGKAHAEAVRHADHVLQAFEDRFPEEKEKADD